MLSPRKETLVKAAMNSPEMCMEDLIMTSNEILWWNVKDVIKMLREFWGSGPSEFDLAEVAKEVKSWSMGESIHSRIKELESENHKLWAKLENHEKYIWA